MKIKSKDYWDLQGELEELRAANRMNDDRVADIRRQAQEWRARYELLQSGGVDGKAEREKAWERGRQHGVLSLRGYLMDALNALASAPKQDSEEPMTTADVEGAVNT